MPQTHMVYGDVQNLPSALATLETLPLTEHAMLSVVLDTSIARVPRQAYLLHFRDAVRNARSGLAEKAPDDLNQFDAAVEHVDQFLRHQFSPRNPGLALYVSVEPEFFLAVPMPNRPTEEVVWDHRPFLAPLIETLDEYERIAVALVDRQEARIFTVFLGSIKLQGELSIDLPGRRAPGDWPFRTKAVRVREGRFTPGMGATVAWSGMVQPGHERRRSEHVEKHLRHVAGMLMDLLRDRPFDRLYLAGPEEAVAKLHNALPRPLQTRYAASIAIPIGASEAEVLAEAKEAAEQSERQEELAIVRRLLEGTGRGSAVAGLEPTLQAVSEGRVDKLVLAPEFPGSVRACVVCGRLTTEESRCPVCGSALEDVGDVRERLITETLNAAGRFEMVEGEAATLLLEHGGVGAFTRY